MSEYYRSRPRRPRTEAGQMSEQFKWHWQVRIEELEDRIEALEAVLRDIQRYSVGDPRPRHTWYYDRAEAALAPEPEK